jgi:hypothetical protein
MILSAEKFIENLHRDALMPAMPTSSIENPGSVELPQEIIRAAGRG